MSDQNRYEELPFPADCVVTALIFRSSQYYNDWISDAAGSEAPFSFHCSSCDNPATRVPINQGHYLDRNTGPILDKATAAFGGVEGVNEINGYHFSSMYAHFIRCKQCLTSHLVVLSYTEHQPSRDVFKLSTIFTIANP